MPSYTFQDLNGTGSIGAPLNSSTTYIFTFTNPSASSYFTMETIPVTGKGWFDETSPKNFVGTYSASNSMGLVTSSYVASVVVQSGTSSFEFTPDNNVTDVTYYLKGTGMYFLNIT